MSKIIIQSRRSFITGLGALIAAPAIIKIAPIMPIKVNNLLTIEEITNAAIKIFVENNPFVPNEFYFQFWSANEDEIKYIPIKPEEIYNVQSS